MVMFFGHVSWFYHIFCIFQSNAMILNMHYSLRHCNHSPSVTMVYHHSAFGNDHVHCKQISVAPPPVMNMSETHQCSDPIITHTLSPWIYQCQWRSENNQTSQHTQIESVRRAQNGRDPGRVSM